MARLSRMSISLKTQLDTELTGLDVFVGPNGSGKSSILESIQYLVTGRIPGILERDLMLLSPDGHSIAVTAHTSAGDSYLRSRRGGRTTIRLDPGRGEQKQEQKDRRLAEVFGSPYILDINTLVGLTAPEQRRRLLELAGSKLNEEQVRDLSGDGWQHLRHLWQGDASAFISDARVYARGRRLEAERALRDADAALRTIPEPICVVEEELRAAEERVADLQKQVAAYRTVQQLTAQFADLPHEPPPPPEVDAEVAGILHDSLRHAEQELSDLQRGAPDESGILRVIESGRCPLAPSAVVCPALEPLSTALVSYDPATVQSAAASVASLRSEVVRVDRVLEAARTRQTQYADSQAMMRAITSRLERLAGVEDASVELGQAIEARDSLLQQNAEREAWDKLAARRAEVMSAHTLWESIESTVGQDSALAAAILQTGFGSLVESADSLLEAIGRGYRFMPPGEGGLGLIRSGLALPWDVLSTGERTVLGLVMCLCLILTQHPEVPVVLIDNFEALDRHAQEGVLRILEPAYEQGMIANVIVAAVSLSAHPGPKWTITELSPVSGMVGPE